MYQYFGKCVAVHDGDTCTLDIDLGFGIWIRGMKIRLDGINAPELSTAAGKLSRTFLADTILLADVIVQTRKTSRNNPADAQEKFGRYLATIRTLPPADINVNELLVTKGFAQVVNYEAKKLR